MAYYQRQCVCWLSAHRPNCVSSELVFGCIFENGTSVFPKFSNSCLLTAWEISGEKARNDMKKERWRASVSDVEAFSGSPIFSILLAFAYALKIRNEVSWRRYSLIVSDSRVKKWCLFSVFMPRSYCLPLPVAYFRVNFSSGFWLPSPCRQFCLRLSALYLPANFIARIFLFEN